MLARLTEFAVFAILALGAVAVPRLALSQPSIYTGDNQFAGYYIGGAGLEAPVTGANQGTAFRAVSIRGYAFGAGTTTGRITRWLLAHPGAGFNDSLVGNEPGAFFFTSTDCSGTAQVQLPGITSTSRITGGVVFSLGFAGASALYYIPKLAESQTGVELRSLRNSVGCLPTAFAPGETHHVLEVLPNDPNVTGVPNAPFLPPLRIEPFPLSDLRQLFRDGFESKAPGNV